MEMGDYIHLKFRDDGLKDENGLKRERNNRTVHGICTSYNGYLIGIAATNYCVHKDLQLRVLRDASLLDKIPIGHVDHYLKIDRQPRGYSYVYANNCLELYLYKIISAFLKNECSMKITFSKLRLIKVDYKKIQIYSIENIEKGIIKEILKLRRTVPRRYYKSCAKFFLKEERWLTEEGKGFSNILKSEHIDKQLWIYEGIRDWSGSSYII
jgi:hypothetical protein